jgi:hypothetical protein
MVVENKQGDQSQDEAGERVAEDRERLERDLERLKDDEARVEEDIEDLERDERRKAGDKTIKLLVIVSGDEVKVRAKPDELLSEVAEKALKKSEHVGRPLKDWVMRNEAGEILNMDRTVESYHLKDDAILSLTLEAGVAG